MSKKIEASVKCSKCAHTFNVSLYRSLWLEYPENLELVKTNKLNRFECPQCRYENQIPFSCLCVNAKKGIAVWYEPFPDKYIDEDIENYRKSMGASSFYARAPRIHEWNKFRDEVVRLMEIKAERDPLIIAADKKEVRDFFGSSIQQMLEIERKIQKEYPQTKDTPSVWKGLSTYFKSVENADKIQNAIHAQTEVIKAKDISLHEQAKNMLRSLAPEIIAVLILSVAVIDPPYTSSGYYDFLRLIITVVAGYSAYRAWQKGMVAWLWIFIAIALLYNPVFRVELERDQWSIFNCISGVIVAIFPWRIALLKSTQIKR